MSSIVSNHPTRRNIIGCMGAALVSSIAGQGYGQISANRTPRIAGLFTVPIEQRWASRMHLAALNSQHRRDATYDYWDDIPIYDYEKTFRVISSHDYDLIIGDAFAVEDKIRKLILDYPDKAYLMGSERLPGTNHTSFCVFENYIQDASYLTGLIAGGITQNEKIGMVGGYASRETNRLMNAFISGAREVNKEVKFYVNFLDSWYNPDLEREFVISQFNEGVDIVYAERSGVAEIARELQILAIGSLTDQSSEYPETMVTSALWHFEPTLRQALSMLRNNSYRTRNMSIFSYLKHDGCAISPLRQFISLVPEYILELVARREYEIRSGAFEVAIVDAIPTSS